MVPERRRDLRAAVERRPGSLEGERSLARSVVHAPLGCLAGDRGPARASARRSGDMTDMFVTTVTTAARPGASPPETAVGTTWCDGCVASGVGDTNRCD